jgi:hypothetical protein
MLSMLMLVHKGRLGPIFGHYGRPPSGGPKRRMRTNILESAKARGILTPSLWLVPTAVVVWDERQGPSTHGGEAHVET